MRYDLTPQSFNPRTHTGCDFDHTVINVKGKKDFMILGNSFYSDLPEYQEKKGGSCEPGIVMVSFDTNQNGLPDDEWYELAGSEY